jgi:hypothetical protein
LENQIGTMRNEAALAHGLFVLTAFILRALGCAPIANAAV